MDSYHGFAHTFQTMESLNRLINGFAQTIRTMDSINGSARWVHTLDSSSFIQKYHAMDSNSELTQSAHNVGLHNGHVQRIRTLESPYSGSAQWSRIVNRLMQ